MRANTIKLIHIARRSLGLDNDTYRTMLAAIIPGKSSCRDMSQPELQKVLKAMEEKGFKVKPTKKPRRMSSPSDTSLKIRAVWHTMHSNGFVRDGSDTALDRFVKRQTSQINGGQGVASLEWLRGDMEVTFLESLKQWHIRAMKKALTDHGLRLPVNPSTGDEMRDYDTLCWAYSEAAKRWVK
ncbi:regulatory protein GemA [Salmonella enterica subsp. enterica serovar Java]|nr:regulatory protein GemA [Salmonella enterica subsp. enterica serovar Java]